MTFAVDWALKNNDPSIYIWPSSSVPLPSSFDDGDDDDEDGGDKRDGGDDDDDKGGGDDDGAAADDGGDNDDGGGDLMVVVMMHAFLPAFMPISLFLLFFFKCMRDYLGV